ncbi:hypothetical protein [Microbulbifer sp. YPW1]|uniref:hypothetical protein n=1 Tax=Microbulbifer sp. YPW1 TaxID=2745199 RepID=UPI0015988731|nr:hypothetical protein [Microbulbifer sp. YPW1]QKX17532.1 hypothetical protein HUW35_11315 [Microbulbifer sp. YPW1]
MKIQSFPPDHFFRRIAAVDWVTFVSLLVLCGAMVILVDAWTFGDSSDSTLSSQFSSEPDNAMVSARQATPAVAADSITQRETADHRREVADTDTYAITAVDLLGVSVQLRELREGDDQAGEGSLRNIEFFIRDGIVPRRLFSDGAQVITRYWPLYHNNVGYGATTVRILFQYVASDSNVDGKLDREDRQSLAMSLPDGSHFRVLDRDAGEIVDMTYFSDRSELQVHFFTQGTEEQRMYSLATD